MSSLRAEVEAAKWFSAFSFSFIAWPVSWRIKIMIFFHQGENL